MIVSGYIRELWVSRPQLCICNGVSSGDSHTITADLSEYTEPYSDEYGLLDRRILNAVFDGETPDWYNGTPYGLVTSSIEGQEFLEYVFGERLHIRAPLQFTSRGTGTRIDHMPRRDIERDERWEVNPPEIDVQQEVFSRIDGTAPEYIYTISVVDNNDEEIYYVGKTVNPIARLTQHASAGGDFAESRRRGDTFLRKIHSIKPSTEVTEREQYHLVQDDVHEEVYGGR